MRRDSGGLLGLRSRLSVSSFGLPRESLCLVPFPVSAMPPLPDFVIPDTRRRSSPSSRRRSRRGHEDQVGASRKPICAPNLARRMVQTQSPIGGCVSSLTPSVIDGWRTCFRGIVSHRSDQLPKQMPQVQTRTESVHKGRLSLVKARRSLTRWRSHGDDEPSGFPSPGSPVLHPPRLGKKVHDFEPSAARRFCLTWDDRRRSISEVSNFDPDRIVVHSFQSHIEL